MSVKQTVNDSKPVTHRKQRTRHGLQNARATGAVEALAKRSQRSRIECRYQCPLKFNRNCHRVPPSKFALVLHTVNQRVLFS